MTGAPGTSGGKRVPGRPLPRWEGEPVEALRDRWGLARLDVHATLPSTNARLGALAREGAAPWTAVVADAQSEGRGRGGSGWHSPAGLGLWMSVLLPPALEPAEAPVTPIVVGMAVARAVEEVVPGGRPRLKWPNDVYLGGRKVCGILCEGVGRRGVVAGFGVNVAHGPDDFPPHLRERAGSLRMASGREVSRRALAGGVLAELRSLCDPPPGALDGALARELEGLDLLRGRQVLTDAGVEGRAVGIDGEGALLVERDDGGCERVLAGGVRPEDERGMGAEEDGIPGSGGA